MKSFMKERRLICLLMILCLALSLTVSVAAETAEENETEQMICTECREPAALADGLCASCAEPATNPLVSYLVGHSAILLFLCIGLGDLLGRVKIKNYTLFGATAGTLLVGLVMSQFVSVEFPGILGTVFFSLFCFTIGFESGPSFFSSMKNTGIKIMALAAFFAVAGLGTTFAVSKLAGLDVGESVGLMAGALTQTSIIGAACLEDDMASSAAVAYALTYVFGTLGVIVFVKNLAPILLGEKLNVMVKNKMDHLGRASGKGSGSAPKTMTQLRAYKLLPEFKHQTVADFEDSTNNRVEIVAVYHNGEAVELDQGYKLLAEDVIQVVGDVEALNIADDSGLCEVTDPAYYQVQVISRTIVLTGDFTANGAEILSGLGLLINRHAGAVTFKKRSAVTVTGSKRAIDEAAKIMGYLKAEGHNTDITVLSLIIAAGLVIGSLALTLSDLTLSLGESVGVLLAGLVCGAIYNRKPRSRQIPPATRLFLKNLGLNLYIGVLALRVGNSFREAMSSNGWMILLLGIVVTLVPHILSLFFGKYVLGLDHVDLLGGLCGGGTCTAAANSLNDAAEVSIFDNGYTTGYAVGSILLTIMGLLFPILF